MLIRATHEFPAVDDRLFYSYDTCATGQHDIYGDSVSAALGAGRAVRVGFPFSLYPLHYKRLAGGEAYYGRGDVYADDSIPWEGIFVDYVRALAAEAPWGNLSFHGTSTGAQLAVPNSSWTAAVHDVGSGVFDLGASDFWVTRERADMSGFSHEIYEEHLYLWVPRPALEGDIGFFEAATKIFKPFAASLWLTLAAIVVGTATINTWLQSLGGPEESVQDVLTTDASKAAKGAREAVSWLAELRRSSIRLLSGTVAEDGPTPAQSIANVGWAILTLLTLTAYTANLAAFLVVRSPASITIGSMHDAVQQRVTLCTVAQLEPMLRSLHPEVRLAILVDDEVGDVASYVAKGCAGWVDTIEQISVIQSYAKWMCSLQLFAVELLGELVVAFPVRPWLASSLSYWSIHMETVALRPFRSFAPLSFATCDDVYREELEATASRRHLAALSGAVAGAVAAGGGAADAATATALLTWTERGEVVVDGLSELTVKHLTFAILAWAIFYALAIVRALWDIAPRRPRRTATTTANQVEPAAKPLEPTEADTNVDVAPLEAAEEDMVRIVKAALREVLSGRVAGAGARA